MEIQNDKRDPVKVARQHRPPFQHGCNILGDPENAAIIQTALKHFDCDRYALVSWSVMSNHVHTVFQPWNGYNPDNILQAWKSFSAHALNKRMARSGPVWERESFDHAIRTGGQLEQLVEYTELNPVEAGLCDTAANWPFSNQGCGFVMSPAFKFVPVAELERAPIQFRGELPHLYIDGATYFVTFCLFDAFDGSKRR